MSNLAAQDQFGYTREQIDTIKNTVGKGLTDSELQMFLHVAKTYNLDPFLREIQPLKGKDGRITIYTTRDGYLKIAHNAKEEFEGFQSDVLRKGDIFKRIGSEVHHEYGQERGAIIGAWAVVKRKSKSIPFYFFAPFAEYYKGNADNWKQYPSAMIQKVAEAMCLKRGFSISGLVSQEELGHEPSKEELPPTSSTKEDLTQLSAISSEDAIDVDWAEVENDDAEEARKLREAAQTAQEKQAQSKPIPGKDPKIAIWERFLAFYKNEKNAAAMIYRIVGNIPSKNWTRDDLYALDKHLRDAGEGKPAKSKTVSNSTPKSEPSDDHDGDALAQKMGIGPDPEPEEKEPAEPMKKSAQKMAYEEKALLVEQMTELFMEKLGLSEKKLHSWLKEKFGVESIDKMVRNQIKEAIKMGKAVLEKREAKKNEQ